MRGAGVLVIENNEILLVEETESNPEYFKFAGDHGIPVGHRRPGETLEATARREGEEETREKLVILFSLGRFDMPFAYVEIFFARRLNPGPRSDGGELKTFWTPVKEVLQAEPGAYRPPTQGALMYALSIINASRRV